MGKEGDPLGVDVPHRSHPILVLIAGWLSLAAVVLIDIAIFQVMLDEAYMRWYLENGATIGLLSGFVVLTLDLDRTQARHGLISLNAFRYLAACVSVVAMIQLSWSATFGVPTLGERADDARLRRWSNGHKFALVFIQGFDLVTSTLLAAISAVAACAWLLLIVPMQYFLFVICGAPARMAERSESQTYVLDLADRRQLTVADKSNPVPQDAIGFGIGTRPVTVTTFFGAALLALASQLL